MSWAKAARNPLSEHEGIVSRLGEPGEVFLPPLMATDWLQYLALAPRLSRREATVQSRCQLYLTDRRLLILRLGHLSYELPLRSVLEVEVGPPPGRKVGGWKLARALYRVETMRVVHQAEAQVIKAVFYDAGADTRPFSEKLLEHVGRQRSRRREQRQGR